MVDPPHAGGQGDGSDGGRDPIEKRDVAIRHERQADEGDEHEQMRNMETRAHDGDGRRQTHQRALTPDRQLGMGGLNP